MSLFARLLQAVRSWRGRRGGPKTVRRTGITMEQLDHRQLLSVNFTGNVPIDFPATKSPGVVVLQDNPLVQHPSIAPDIASIVKVSGFDITGIRVSYTPATDTLSMGLDQPASQNQPGSVIAGDADNNGNSGSVNPAVQAVPGFAGFQDVANFGGTENMGAFLDFTGTGVPQVVVGFSAVPPTATPTDPTPQKPFQVALAIPTGPNSAPAFGTRLNQFEGNFYYNNSSAHPHLEFDIRDFSQLYLAVTGQTLTSSTVFNVGAFGGSAQDIGIGEAFFPEQPVELSNATIPPTNTPVSPPILINPHEHRVIDTGHRDLVRVYIVGTSGFDPTTIIPETVDLNGASPIASFTRHFARLEFPVQTFVFVGSDIDLPAGMTTATFTGETTSGQQISTSKQVLNIPFSAEVPGRLRSLMGEGTAYSGFRRLQTADSAAVSLDETDTAIPTTVRLNMAPAGAARAVRVNYRSQVSSSGTTTPVAMPRNVVSLRSTSTGPTGRGNVSRRLSQSLSEFLASSSAR